MLRTEIFGSLMLNDRSVVLEQFKTNSHFLVVSNNIVKSLNSLLRLKHMNLKILFFCINMCIVQIKECRKHVYSFWSSNGAWAIPIM